MNSMNNMNTVSNVNTKNNMNTANNVNTKSNVNTKNNVNTVNNVNTKNNMNAVNTANTADKPNTSNSSAEPAVSNAPEGFIETNFVINVFNAVIDDISSDRGNRFVTISYEECVRCENRGNRVTLVIDNDTLIIDQWGNTVGANKLQRGMNINASFSSVMTRSIPPQARAFTIQLLNNNSAYNTTVGRIVNINHAERFITVLTNSGVSPIIRFNIAPDAVILTPFGRTTGLSGLTAGMLVRITHATFMTLSIPPQTTAYRIQILR